MSPTLAMPGLLQGLHLRRTKEAERVPMQARVKKFVLLVVGWSFLVLGVIGLFLPVLQGVLFIIVGLLILSSEYVWAHKLLQKIRWRFPEFASRWDKAADKAHRWTGQVFHRTRPLP